MIQNKHTNINEMDICCKQMRGITVYKKILRLLQSITGDLNESSMTIAKIYGNENEPEIADKVIYASDKIIEAKKAVVEATDVLRRIYDYDD